MSTITLKDLLDRPTNGFNQVRLLAAILVVASHSYMLVFGNGEARPLSWGPYELGSNAVNVFFFLSGLLLMGSLERDARLLPFAVARVLRIFPALIVSSVFTAWVLVPLALTQFHPSYYLGAHAIWYPLDVLWQFETAHIDGAWAGSTYPNESNVPLWTIKYELLAYTLLCAAVALGIFKTRSRTLFLCMSVGVCLAVTDMLGVFQGSVGWLLRFAFCFLLGVCAHQYREAIPINAAVAWVLAAIALPLGLTVYGAPVWILSFSYVALAFGGVTVPYLSAATQRFDISYGLYILTWPIQQVMTIKLDWPQSDVGAILHAVLALVVTLPAALLSWFVVEKLAIEIGRRFRASRPIAGGQAKAF
ncbi:MAG: acyltransferase [Devosia sp.]|uniref:acyltransferase family protein n=1 Tax=Devosia sp. 66-22 TaxID=1895753 RepID=UPI000928A30B|nr:acyltransferase [Devosia sp. 66-22]MBN9348040.1 acyltransferase [Devosia sp.]OJX46549.1 MAG: hypothetical protein BGO81_04110 [Devosia sp. 66-22]